VPGFSTFLTFASLDFSASGVLHRFCLLHNILSTILGSRPHWVGFLGWNSAAWIPFLCLFLVFQAYSGVQVSALSHYSHFHCLWRISHWVGFSGWRNSHLHHHARFCALSDSSGTHGILTGYLHSFLCHLFLGLSHLLFFSLSGRSQISWVQVPHLGFSQVLTAHSLPPQTLGGNFPTFLWEVLPHVPPLWVLSPHLGSLHIHHLSFVLSLVDFSLTFCLPAGGGFSMGSTAALCSIFTISLISFSQVHYVLPLSPGISCLQFHLRFLTLISFLGITSAYLHLPLLGFLCWVSPHLLPGFTFGGRLSLLPHLLLSGMEFWNFICMDFLCLTATALLCLLCLEGGRREGFSASALHFLGWSFLPASSFTAACIPLFIPAFFLEESHLWVLDALWIYTFVFLPLSFLLHLSPAFCTPATLWVHLDGVSATAHHSHGFSFPLPLCWVSLSLSFSLLSLLEEFLSAGLHCILPLGPLSFSLLGPATTIYYLNSAVSLPGFFSLHLYRLGFRVSVGSLHTPAFTLPLSHLTFWMPH